MPGKFGVFDRLIEGVQVIDRNWEYVYVNEAVAMQGKSSREELLGHTMMEKYPGIENSKMFIYLRDCMENGTPKQMVNRFIFPDGSKAYFDLRMRRIDEGVLIFSFDVTQQKELENMLQNANTMLEEKVKQRTEELMAKNKELEQFAYITSHDLREPLLTIKNYTSMFLEEQDVSESVHPYAAYITSAVTRMEALINGMLDYARLSRAKEIKEVDCNEVMKMIFADLHDLIRREEASVSYEPLPVLKAYPIELQQLFQNLITNAVKFRKKDVRPEIHISAQKTEGGWKFSVCDNGIGIRKEDKEKIFMFFQRLHHASEYEGTGIGLAHCKKIAEIHNGTITVESETGKGSCFYFTILTESV